MEEVLQYLLQQSDEYLGKQIQYILQQLNSPEEDEEVSSEEEEENEEEEVEIDDEEDEYLE